MEYLLTLLLNAIESAAGILLCSACLEWRSAPRLFGGNASSPKARFLLAWGLFTAAGFVFFQVVCGTAAVKGGSVHAVDNGLYVPVLANQLAAHAV